MSSTRNKKIDFSELRDIIIKHTNSKDLFNVLNRIKSTSKTHTNYNNGDEINNLLNYLRHFSINKSIISNNSIYTTQSYINKITYKTIPITDIINSIFSDGFAYILNEKNNKAYILFNNNKFIFDAFNVKDSKYYDIDGFIRCKCSLQLDNSSNHKKKYVIIPDLNSETIETYKLHASNDEYIHLQNSNYKKTIEYIMDYKQKTVSISKINYINNNKVFIELNIQ